MTEFFMGLQAGAVLLVACALFTLFIFTFLEKCGKINKDGKVTGEIEKSDTKTVEKSEKSDNEKELRAARAAIRNFYLYDGSEQKDPFEIADEEMQKRG